MRWGFLACGFIDWHQDSQAREDYNKPGPPWKRPVKATYNNPPDKLRALYRNQQPFVAELCLCQKLGKFYLDFLTLGAWKWRTRGQGCTADQATKEAQEAFNKVIADYSDQTLALAEARLGLAVLAENNHQWDEARKQYEAILTKSGPLCRHPLCRRCTNQDGQAGPVEQTRTVSGIARHRARPKPKLCPICHLLHRRFQQIQRHHPPPPPQPVRRHSNNFLAGARRNWRHDVQSLTNARFASRYPFHHRARFSRGHCGQNPYTRWRFRYRGNSRSIVARNLGPDGPAIHHRQKFESFQTELSEAISQLQKATALLAQLIDEDIAAYAGLSAFLKLPEEQRLKDPSYLPAVVAAIRAPQSVGGLGLHILELCHNLREKTNPFLLSDLAIAATLAHATVHASELNVLINLNLLPDKSEATRLRQEMHAMSDKADGIYNVVREFVCHRL